MLRTKTDKMNTHDAISANAYKEVVIYYFSGTGNSRNVAFWLSQVGKEKGVECRMINLAEADRLSIQAPEPDSLIVFVSPIHGFNYPPVMLNFILRFPKGKNRVVLMNTRAGMLIGNFVTPGITGIAFYLSALILFLKGFTIRAVMPVDMPSNWISLHPGLNERTVRYLHVRNKERVLKFAVKILQGKSHFKPLFEVYDILFAPIAIGYFLVGRFILAKTFYASADCNLCDQCIRACPVKAIVKVDNRPFWTFNCESCMKCMSYCPKKAIETGHGFIFAFLFIFFNIILIFFYKYFNAWGFMVENSLMKMVLESVLILAFLGLWYRLVHWMLRFRIIERLTVFSSLTKLKWWGRRYKALKNF